MFRKLLILILSLVCSQAYKACAADVQWIYVGMDTKWSSTYNWVPSLPGIFDKAKINNVPGPVVKTGMTAVAREIFVAESGLANCTVTVNGGSLSTVNQFLLGYYSADKGKLVVNGGTVNIGASGGVDGNLLLGFNGSGTLQVNGGTVVVANNFGVGWDAASVGHVDMTGGSISCKSFIMANGAGSKATMDITGGELIIDGDRQSHVNIYISSGWITAFGGLGTVFVDYSQTHSGKTTVRAVNDFTKARLPQPSYGDEDVAPYEILSWYPGDYAVSHDIYLDTSNPPDFNVSQESNVFIPDELELGQTYYWRVDEVNGPDTWTGDIWSFTVADFALVDDFEAYSDNDDMLLYWSEMTAGTAIALQTADAHGESSQSIQIDYDNSTDPYYSEARNILINSDWAISGVAGLDIWIKGSISNSAEQVYLALEDDDGNPVGIVYNDDMNAALSEDWQVWRVNVSDFSGVNVENVKYMYIGLGDRANPTAGGSGAILVDAIQLHPPRCIARPDCDISGDCVVDFRDFAIIAENWLDEISLEI